MNFSVNLPDSRHEISDCKSGTYYVQKKRILLRFGFGPKADFSCAKDAHSAMLSFLDSREDAKDLFVNLVEFEN